MEEKSFQTILRTENWEFQKISDDSNIIDFRDETLDSETLMNRIQHSVKIEKEKYGFGIYWIDNNQRKSTHIRDDENYINVTVKSKQTITDFVQMIYQQQTVFV